MCFLYSSTPLRNGGSEGVQLVLWQIVLKLGIAHSPESYSKRQRSWKQPAECQTMVAEVIAWVFNTVAVLVLWPTSLPCPIKPEFDLLQLRSMIDGAMPMSCYAETEMTELNVPCTMIFMIFLFLFFLILPFFSEWPFCLLFMICFQLPFCLAKHCVAWLGDDVSLLEKSCPFSESLQCPSAWPNLWSSRLPFISWCERFNDVASLCSASAGMLYSSGFPEGLCRRSSLDWLSHGNVAHVCSSFRSQILWNCFYHASHSPRGRNRVHWPASEEESSAQGPFIGASVSRASPLA